VKALSLLYKQHDENTSDTPKILYPLSASSTKSGSQCTQITSACDIFSFGIVLFEVIGHTNLPGNGERWQKLRNENNSSFIKDLLEQTDRSESLINLVPLLLKVDPSLRMKAADILDYIQHYQTSTPTSTSPLQPSSLTSPQQQIFKRPAVRIRKSTYNCGETCKRPREHKRNFSAESE